MTDKIKYYTKPAKRTAVSAEFAARFDKTPTEIMNQARQIMIHPNENSEKYSSQDWPHWITVSDLEKEFKNHNIILGTCRHFAMLPVAIMREKNIPARCRYGFATYLSPGFYESHWIVEYWDSGWKMADVQAKNFNISANEFMNGGIAWQQVRKHNFDPELFGFADNTTGLYHVATGLIRDAGGLLKHELGFNEECELIKDEHKLELAFLDKLSAIVLSEDVKGLESLIGRQLSGR